MASGFVGVGSYRRHVRILHTSDWHLGRSFHREGMLEHQAAYVDHLLEVVESERVDLVVVAGDVYDRALPTSTRCGWPTSRWCDWPVRERRSC